MYALVFTYEGNVTSTPYSNVIAISEDKDKLIEKMREDVKQYLEIDNDNPRNENCNFHLEADFTEEIVLEHNHNDDLYIKYFIQYDIEII
jgi:hypothetical protein